MFFKCLKEKSPNYIMAVGQMFLLIGIVSSRYGLMGKRIKGWLLNEFRFLSDDMILGIQDGMSVTLFVFSILFITHAIVRKRQEKLLR